MQNKAKETNNSRQAFLLAHSPGHQPFNKNGTIKVNRTNKKQRKAK